MSFWTTSTGEDIAAEQPQKEYDAGGGNFEPLPDGSTVAAFVETAKWDANKDGDRYINIKWKVEAPEAYAGRIVFQKLWVKDADPNAKDINAKRDKALRMLATIDANAGGKLAKKGTMPTDDELAIALTSKQMTLSLGVWEMGDASGNWVRKVAPKGGETKVPGPKPQTKGDPFDDLDDEIPF